MLCEVMAIFLGGGLGAVLRYLITQYSNRSFGISHYGTFAVNVLGCLLIGFVIGITINKITLPNELKLFIMVGFLGGLTTFSTFNSETFYLLKSGNILHGLGYVMISCVLGLLSTCAGYYLGKI